VRYGRSESESREDISEFVDLIIEASRENNGQRKED